MSTRSGPRNGTSPKDNSRVLADIERRGRPRLNIELPCLRVDQGRRKPPAPVGRTVNISRSGLLVRWEADGSPGTLPLLGEKLTFDIELLPNRFGRKCIRCWARVVRLSADGDAPPLVAAAIDQMEFRDAAGGLMLVPKDEPVFEGVLPEE